MRERSGPVSQAVRGRVHAGVTENLGKRVTSSQIRSGAAPTAAAVHASVPLLDGRTVDHLGCAPVKERHQKLNALELERCTRLANMTTAEYGPHATGERAT